MKMLILVLSFIFCNVAFAQRVPLAVAVKTGSYTIPARRFAVVVVNVEGSGTFTIDGATAIRGTQYGILASDNLGNVNSIGALMANAVATNTASGTAFTEGTAQETVAVEIVVPTGTIINGTGTWRATVTEYSI